MSTNKLEKQNSFMKNVAIIFISQVLVKVLGMVYRIVITNFQGFGDSGNGFYSAGFQVYTLLLAISSVGIPNAISKLVSERAAVGNYDGANKLFKTALALFAGIGLVLALALYFLSGFVANVVINMPGAEYVMRALAPSIFFVCVSSVIRGYFAGLNDMNATGTSQVLEQFFKSALTIIFVLFAIGQKPEIMAAWANFATSVACILSLGYLVIFYLRKRNGLVSNIKASSGQFTLEKPGKIIKAVLMLAIPISIASVITSINRIIDTSTITRGIEIAFATYIPAHGGVAAIVNPTLSQVQDEAARLAGLLSKSDTLINLPLAMNIAFATVLVPTIANKLTTGDKDGISKEISFSMLISILIVMPCAAGYIALAQPIYNLIYPNASLGAPLLQLSAVVLIFSAITQTITGALQGFGKVHIPVIGLLIGCVCKIVLNLVLISNPNINIYGAVISSIVCQIISFVVCMIGLKSEVKLGFGLMKYIIKPITSCLTMAVVAKTVHYLIIKVFGVGMLINALATFVAICLAAIVYLVLVIAWHILDKEEISRLPMGNKIVKFIK